MNIEQAIKRRARLGQSFCSYTFKPVVNKTGMLFYKAQRMTKQYSSSKSSLHTMDTICLQSSRLKSTTRKSAMLHQKQNSNKVNSKSILRRKTQKDYQSVAQPEINIKQSKLHKMDQYLADYFSLRKEPQLKSNTYQNIPKNLYKQTPTNSIPFQKLHFSYQSPFATYTINCQASDQQSYFGRQKQIQKLPFISAQQPQLFYDLGIDQNCQLPYTHFKMVDIHNKMMIQSPVSQGIFSQIPMKQFCHSFNNYSTKLQQNIFYIALSKQKLADQQYYYTQCFFWISKPIKHSQRQHAFQLIVNFYESCLSQMNWKQTSQTQQQQQQVRVSIDQQQNLAQSINIIKTVTGGQQAANRLWVVDFNGKISFINKQQVQRNRQRATRQHKINDLSINLHNVQSVCLSMFLSSIKRGTFSHRTIVHENNSNNINNENPFNLFASLTNSVVQC